MVDTSKLKSLANHMGANEAKFNELSKMVRKVTNEAEIFSVPLFWFEEVTNEVQNMPTSIFSLIKCQSISACLVMHVMLNRIASNIDSWITFRVEH